MISFVCFLKGHKPYYVMGEQIGYNSYLPGRRYCGRCDQPLPGDLPRAGDRRALHDP